MKWINLLDLGICPIFTSSKFFKGVNDANFLIIILLVIQAILIFFRTGLYIIFNKHFLNIDYHLKKPNDEEIDYVLTLFATIRLFLCSTILYLRKFQNDILSYALGYLILSSLIRFYYQYLRSFDQKNPIKNGLIDIRI